MLFQKRVDRAMKHSKEQAIKKQQNLHLQEEQPLVELMEKGDLPALIISALLVFFPIAMLIVIVMCVLGMLPAFL
ncbi:MAG: hypothetical protein IKW28_09365 [Lachnospiraceae bacterium]|nr:hypothetical protein [Lachnospiraceae bacterium]